MKRVRGAAFLTKRADPGSDGSYLTLDALRETLKTPAWSEIGEEDSRLCKLLSSRVFKNEKGLIDVNSLILFGIHHCAGDIESKSTALYGVFQDGGQSQHKNMSASDKDIKPNMNKFITLCTTEIAQLMFEVDQTEPSETQG